MDYRPSILIVAFGKNVFGLDPATGARRWERSDFGFYPRLHVMEHATLVLAQELHCLENAGGRTLWKADTLGETLLYPGGETAFVAGLGETFAVRIRDGHILWHEKFSGKGMGEVSLGVPGMSVQLDRTR
jgi:hypothetical protein